jgi:hypothetical protein
MFIQQDAPTVSVKGSLLEIRQEQECAPVGNIIMYNWAGSQDQGEDGMERTDGEDRWRGRWRGRDGEDWMERTDGDDGMERTAGVRSGRSCGRSKRSMWRRRGG